MNTEATYTDHPSMVDTVAGQPGLRRAASAVSRIARRIMKPMLRAHWKRQAIHELSGLPSFILRDIGVRPDDIRSVAADLARDQADAWARRTRGSNGFGD